MENFLKKQKASGKEAKQEMKEIINKDNEFPPEEKNEGMGKEKWRERNKETHEKEEEIEQEKKQELIKRLEKEEKSIFKSVLNSYYFLGLA